MPLKNKDENSVVNERENFVQDMLATVAAGLAQSVERLTAEREVAGSIPGTRPILRVLK